MKIFLSVAIAIGVSLLASRSVIVHHANSATSVTAATLPHSTHSLKQWKLWHRIRLTAYVPKKGSITTSGTDANFRPGIAAAWNVFPKGTKIILPGKAEPLIVDDTGEAMKKDAKHGIPHIDLRILPDYRHGITPRVAQKKALKYAMAIGKQWIDAYVILPQKSSRNG